MTEQESTIISSRKTMTDALVELYDSFFNPKKNKYLSEIQDPEEAEAISRYYVEADFYADPYTKAYLDLRVQQMLTLNRKNADILRKVVNMANEEKEEPDKNLGVKRDLENLIS